MLKVFNDSSRKFLLEAQDGEKKVILPGKFYDLDEKFQAASIFRLAMQGGELKVYDDVKAAEKMVKEHEERDPEDVKPPKTIEDADAAEQNQKPPKK